MSEKIWYTKTHSRTKAPEYAAQVLPDHVLKDAKAGVQAGKDKLSMGNEVNMIALKITNVKQFMGRLLAGEDFDSFLLEEATISTYNTFHIDGRQNRDFYSSEEWEDKELRPYDFSTWKAIRPVCFNLIKGTRTPSSFQFVLLLIPEYMASILKKGDTSVTPLQIKAFVLNIRYDGTALTLVTGTSYHTFLMDKTPDALWDQSVRQFLSNREIAFEEQ